MLPLTARGIAPVLQRSPSETSSQATMHQRVCPAHTAATFCHPAAGPGAAALSKISLRQQRPPGCRRCTATAMSSRLVCTSSAARRRPRLLARRSDRARTRPRTRSCTASACTCPATPRPALGSAGRRCGASPSWPPAARCCSRRRARRRGPRASRGWASCAGPTSGAVGPRGHTGCECRDRRAEAAPASAGTASTSRCAASTRARRARVHQGRPAGAAADRRGKSGAPGPARCRPCGGR
mmetsp:Transcript_43462/g.125479  ORF Transcript_43462/g.125479 Transcript_43462/m.125479 type:complete len:240 (-) Transcript_43462:1562-2281(-)